MDDNVLNAAIQKFGSESSHLMAIGEIGELLQLFGRMAQGRDSKEEWIDEVADVTIMMRQLAILLGVEAVEERINQKVERLRKRLSSE